MSCYSWKWIAYLLHMSLATVCYVEGNYVLSVTTHYYINPNNHCATCVTDQNRQNRILGCCDRHDRTDHCRFSCDTYFYYCLNELWSQETDCSGGQLSGIFRDSGTNVTFMGLTVLGLKNPLEIEGLTNEWKGAQLFILVGDDDDGVWEIRDDDDLIDIFRININSSIGSSVNRQQYDGIYNVAQIELSYEVSCAENYYGNFCENLNECLLNSVTCNGNGRCQDEQDTFSCVCNPGFTGELCEINIDDCVGVNCRGNGQCRDEVNSFTCECDPGFTGELCEINIECIGIKCSKNSQCIDGGCVCNPGFTGELCEINTDDCVGVNCSGNGQCEDKVNSFSCVCNAGYTGEICDQLLEGADGTNVAAIGGGLAGGMLLIVILLVIIIVVWLLARKLTASGHHTSQSEIEIKENEAYGTTSSMHMQEKFEMKQNAVYGINPSLTDLEPNEAYGVLTGERLNQEEDAYNYVNTDWRTGPTCA